MEKKICPKKEKMRQILQKNSKNIFGWNFVKQNLLIEYSQIKFSLWINIFTKTSLNNANQLASREKSSRGLQRFKKMTNYNEEESFGFF